MILRNWPREFLSLPVVLLLSRLELQLRLSLRTAN
ncbi:hypothetical protein Zm00014a_013207 [Zea mays]|uniref:Uncharacterized protein n=1 Tax=Zea mays TaxID=4577 RepID=A0A3L6FYR3_MAIZE|nr:hypothetical protein Zm00014a_013207 [Zea mays]